jgi:hypothetical protein
VADIAAPRRFDLRKPLVAAAVALVASLLITIYGTDIDWLLYAAAVGVLGGIGLLGSIALRAVFRKRQDVLMALAIFGAYVAVTAVFFVGYGELRPILRWSLWSQRYKSELLAQATPASGQQLKHVEWERSGWGPVGPTIVYLVFDPTDSLSVAAKSHRAGRFSGIPCEVPRVQRLEGHWYAVTFYTEESWGERNRLDCTGAGA